LTELDDFFKELTKWEENVLEKSIKGKEMRQTHFKNLSDIEIKGLYTPLD